MCFVRAWEISLLNTYLLIFDSVVCVQDVFLRLFKDTDSGDSIDVGVGMKRKADVAHSTLKTPLLAEGKQSKPISKNLEVSMCLSVLLMVCLFFRGMALINA